MGRVTESIWSRHGNAAHPKTWTRRADVRPGLLLRLRTPHIDGERCPATLEPDSTPVRPAHAALAALQERLEQKWSAQVRQTIDSGIKAGSMGLQQQPGLSLKSTKRQIMPEVARKGASAANSGLRRALNIRPGTRTRTALEQLTNSQGASGQGVNSATTRNLTSDVWFALVASSQPRWTPRDSSCPLFARKFAATTAGAVARAYAAVVLPFTNTNTEERAGSAV